MNIINTITTTTNEKKSHQNCVKPLEHGVLPNVREEKRTAYPLMPTLTYRACIIGSQRGSTLTFAEPKKTNHIVLDLREGEKKKIRQADRFGAYLSASKRHHKPVLEVGSHIGNSKFTLQLQDTIKNLV